MSLLYCLLDLGIKIDKNDAKDFVFTYKKEFFIPQSLEKQLMAKRIINDVNKLEEFSLHIRTDPHDPHTQYLSLFFNPNTPQTFSSVQKQRVASFAFESRDDDIEDDDKQAEQQEMDVDNGTENAKRNDAQTLYNRLKRAHALDKSRNEDLSYLQHEKLRPVLRPYQLKAVKWMIDRETKVDAVHIPFIELRSARFPDVTFYMDRFTSRIYDHKPEMRKIPAGGLLCDEMGLGKTVEMLSLILHRKRVEGFEGIGPLADHEYYKKYEIPPNEAKKINLRCICFESSPRLATVICNSCKNRQHVRCVLQEAKFKKTFDTYKCPDCWKKFGRIVESKTTLIVSPLSIKRQWYSEIERHVRDDKFRVFMYEGVKNGGWISPEELASYDVILTDYNVLTSEIYYSKVTERTLRRPSLCAKPVSPLPMVRWYRTCLDEAQMVEITTTHCARMVHSLPALNRWAVTGTPIEKNISTLYGLVYFIGYDPFATMSVWNYYINLYRDGNYAPLIKVLQKVMWRTCKVDVLDEIGLPPQQQVVHYVQMSDLQRFFYRSEHSQYRQVFNERASKVSVTHGISAQTMKFLMEPLRKLRQDCTIPSIFSRTGAIESTQKKLLTPSELHDHMIKNTEVELKTCLRTISSSFNGVAACHIMQEDFNAAFLAYQGVLKLAAEYHDKKIHVDTLLQIHAVHNMISISKNLSGIAYNKDENEKLLAKLEWKYIETYKNQVKEVEDRLKSVQNTMTELKAKELSNRGNAWWRQVLYGPKTDDGLLHKIALDQKDVGMNFAPGSLPGVDLYLTTWIDKVNAGRRKILQNFKDLKYFHGNLKPKSALNEDELFKINYLVESAYNCHLFLIETMEDSDTEERPEPKRTCQLCRAKANLNEYECLIYNKYIWNEHETRGSWNPCEKEYVFKTLLAYAKRAHYDSHITDAGDVEMKLIETLKNEFKEYSQYWVEINYTVSAYDELNMCKSRLEAIDMEDATIIDTNVRKNKLTVPRHMVSEIQQEMQTEKSNAERDFIRIKGRLKYLEHLKEETEPDICPICKQAPVDRYAVMQCGHSLCFICVNQMARFQRNRLTCAICRHAQDFRDIFYATLNSTDTEVLGSYSPKILRIVEVILKIRNDEPDVKIVIFSQWEPILQILTQALKTNNVSHILHTNNHRTIDQIQLFKTGQQTCLLLPLSLGSKGLNLTEATHVFLVEPILNPSEELQAIGRIHRIGQTRPTFVHHFIMKNTIEETIYTTVTNDKSGIWQSKAVSVDDLKKLFRLEADQIEMEF